MAQSAYIAAWIAGLVGGLHCLAMCGGFVAVVSAPGNVQPLFRARTLAFRQILAHAGRLTTYALAGALAGGIGAVALDVQVSALQRSLYAVANVSLLVLAIALVRGRSPFAVLETAGLALFRRVAPAVAAQARGSTIASRYALGLAWGMTPCALVYGVLPLAAFAGSPLEGALVMLAFGAGTLPNLALAGFAAQRARRWIGQHAFRFAAAAIVAGFGIAGLYRLLFVPEALASGPFCLVH